MTPEKLTHGRHCPCSACAREDWTNPRLATCGMHGPECPYEYAPILDAKAVHGAGLDACRHGYMTGTFCSECPGEVADLYAKAVHGDGLHHPDDGHDHSFGCRRCGVDVPAVHGDGLREALAQALDRMEAMWEHMKPDQTDDDRHAIAQNCWFGMEEVRAALRGDNP